MEPGRTTDKGSTFSVLALDDEPIALRRLQRMLSRIETVPQVSTFGCVEPAKEHIERYRPEILFLDVEMPQCSGFQILEGLPQGYCPAVIFATAHSEHATKAFDVHAVDYLHKPFSQQRLATAVSRATERLARNSSERRAQDIKGQLRRLRERTTGASRFLESIWVKEPQQRRRLMVDEVRCFYGEGDYVRVCHQDGDWLWHGTLAKLADELDPERFVRVHKSAIVGLSQIETHFRNSKGGRFLTLKGGGVVPIGRAFTSGLDKHLRERW